MPITIPVKKPGAPDLVLLVIFLGKELDRLTAGTPTQFACAGTLNAREQWQKEAGCTHFHDVHITICYEADEDGLMSYLATNPHVDAIYAHLMRNRQRLPEDLGSSIDLRALFTYTGPTN